jgi:hypothetical protein
LVSGAGAACPYKQETANEYSNALKAKVRM